MESLDYRYHRISINKHTATYEQDGSVRVIVSRRDPQHPNWLEIGSHNEGTMCWRWYRPAKNVELVAPVCEVVNINKFIRQN